MKRFFLMLVIGLISFSAFSFNFTGKTFRAVRTENGIKLTATIQFRANNRAVLSYTATGRGSQTDSYATWEDVGDWINIIDSAGDLTVLGIEQDEDGVASVSNTDL
ncbi:MAG: hypothetical protein K2L89_07740, partial [Muribaculaceae bacterium]|nr:hypothetical protein [Muribaculaceae bacterium]